MRFPVLVLLLLFCPFSVDAGDALSLQPSKLTIESSSGDHDFVIELERGTISSGGSADSCGLRVCTNSLESLVIDSSSLKTRNIKNKRGDKTIKPIKEKLKSKMRFIIIFVLMKFPPDEEVY